MPCGMEGSMSSHDHRCCPFYHSERDRRRFVFVDGASAAYSAEPCNEQFDDPRVCPRGDSCGFCHSTAELLYHPDFFRKRLCHQAKRCPRGRFCAFAHSRQELLVPHFSELEETDPSEDFITWRFKTQWCPIGGPHDWENCVYAHTYRDWRRVPSLGYSSRPCPHWVQSVTTGPPELSYENRCPRGMGCPLAHGAKEQLYHPQFYKTSPCSEANCKRGALCAFTHGAYDLRRPRSDDVISQIREPILEAVEVLGQNQPTFWSPPKYHALEDPPKSTAGPSKSRSRKNSSASTTFSTGASRWSDVSKLGDNVDPSALAPPGDLLPAALPAIAAGTGVEPLSSAPADTLPPPLMGHPAYAPPQYYQWVPYEAPPTQLIPPAIGYSSAPISDPWAMQQMPMGYAPWVWNQPGMNPAAMQQCFMALPPNSPSRGDPQTGPLLDDIALEDQDSLEIPPDGSPKATRMPTCSSPMNIDNVIIPSALPSLTATSPGGTGAQDESPHHLSSMLQINSIPRWPTASLPPGPLQLPLKKPIEEDDEEFIARQHNRYLRKGLRTPSSLGSPPSSAAPTEAPSPRPVEAASRDGSEYVSSDDVAVAVRDPHLLEASMRELPTTHMVMDAMVEPPTLALMEAPHAASPTRSKSVPPL